MLYYLVCTIKRWHRNLCFGIYHFRFNNLPKRFEQNFHIQPKRNIIKTNVFVNVEKQYRWNEDWLEIGDNLNIDYDPGFVEYEIDFSLTNSSEVFEILPGFKNIPFSKIGTQK